MAVTTCKDLRNLLIYQIFVRNHTKEGTFDALVNDLPRIKALGVDYIYLLPIHPIGEVARKGKYGSPYSIKDYRQINKDLGSKEDFINLIEQAHHLGLKVMMDVVFNHTSRDSRLLKERPEWFYKNKDGKFSNRVGEWDDITDLETRVDNGLYSELTSTLVDYIKLGVDGFRCDAASLVPLRFWAYLKAECLKINPNVLFLSESVHGDFLKHFRDLGYELASECEMYQVFDIAYDYDTQPFFDGYLKGKNSFKQLLFVKRLQEQIYPCNYVKLRNLENHDFGRFLSFVNGNLKKSIMWHAEIFFEKGATMIYAGEEFSDMNRPNLFEKDEVNFSGVDISWLIKKMVEIKKDKIFVNGTYNILEPNIDDVFILKYENEEKILLGVFNVGMNQGELKLGNINGVFINLINNEELIIKQGIYELSNIPVIIEVFK